jgi:hypothetical protein
MRGGKVRKLLVLAALGAIVAAVVRALRGEPAPQFSNHPTVLGGPDMGRPATTPEPTAAPAPAPVDDVAAPEPESGPEADLAEADLAEVDVEPEPARVEPEVAPADDAATEAPTAPPASTPARAGVAPVDGRCPEGYPIKGKRSSGIYHQPGGLAYDRTKPDRCYATAADAEADGLRPAKR